MKGNNKYDYIKSLVEVLPDKPGVYQFFDGQGKILYVGKAGNLRKRVSSYFTGSKKEGYKKSVLVGKTKDIKHIVVNTESDALLLENNMIKELQPRYNVLLKDDKTFPWICIKNEEFPRVFYTRRRIEDGSLYYGPYTSVLMVKTILGTARSLFPLRNCQLNLSPQNIAKGKYKVCLEYHIGNCKAPCVGLQEEEEYRDYIEQVKRILEGNIKEVFAYLRGMMKGFAGEFRYEEAQLLKEKLDILEKYRSKSAIVNPRIQNTDVFSFIEEGDLAVVNYLKVVEGAIVQAHTLEMKKKMNESREELLSLAIIDIRNKTMSNSSEIIIPFPVDIRMGNMRFTVPKKGDKKHLLELSERNAKIYRIERKRRIENSKKASQKDRILESVKRDLRLKDLPRHIECFDNSNLMGSDPVAACVVFKDGRPEKSEYRHYHVKTVRGPDDFSSMREIIKRRYSRLMREKSNLPQLIVVDGGKGQLNAAVGILDELGLRGRIAVIGIAKKLEEIYFPGDKVPLYIDKNSVTLRLIQKLRNEAHRFGVAFHRKSREKSMIGSELDNIPGIGEKTKAMLLQNFTSVQAIKCADIRDIENLIGRRKAEILKDHFLRSTT